MHLRPLHDRLIVQRLDEDSTQRVGTIVIPDSAKEKPQRGEVVAVGGHPGDTDEQGTGADLAKNAEHTLLLARSDTDRTRLKAHPDDSRLPRPVA